jgi:hypothetical protein
MRYVIRAIVSVLLVACAFACFYFPRTFETHSVSDDGREIRIEQFGGVEAFLNMIGLFTLVLSVWVWRRELGITQLGPLGGQVIEPAAGAERLPTVVPQQTDDNGDQQDESALGDRFSGYVEEVLFQIRKNPELPISRAELSRSLGVQGNTVSAVLHYMAEMGEIRIDLFTGSRAAYTYAKSTTNRALDYARDVVVPKGDILTEKRQVRIGRAAIVDALVETVSAYYAMEVRHNNASVASVERWIASISNTWLFRSTKPARLVVVIIESPDAKTSAQTVSHRLRLALGAQIETVLVRADQLQAPG